MSNILTLFSFKLDSEVCNGLYYFSIDMESVFHTCWKDPPDCWNDPDLQSCMDLVFSLSDAISVPDMNKCDLVIRICDQTVTACLKVSGVKRFALGLVLLWV